MPPTADFPFYSTTEAAAEVGLTEGRIRQLIRAGEINARPVGRRGYAIPKEEVAKLKRDRDRNPLPQR